MAILLSCLTHHVFKKQYKASEVNLSKLDGPFQLALSWHQLEEVLGEQGMPSVGAPGITGHQTCWGGTRGLIPASAARTAAPTLPSSS